jgi:hypothetical protein
MLTVLCYSGSTSDGCDGWWVEYNCVNVRPVHCLQCLYQLWQHSEDVVGIPFGCGAGVGDAATESTASIRIAIPDLENMGNISWYTGR